MHYCTSIKAITKVKIVTEIATAISMQASTPYYWRSSKTRKIIDEVLVTQVKDQQQYVLNL